MKKIRQYIEKKKTILQSPDSKLVKHAYNLCKICNNEKTQPFDKAYERFFDYLVSHEKNILNTKRINLNKIAINQQDLFKYFIKSFCCVIDRTQYTPRPIEVPKELINALLGDSYNKSLVIQFCINKNATEYPLTKIMMVSELEYQFEDELFYTTYYETYGWLNIRYIYQKVRNKKEYNFRLNKHKIIPNYWIGKSKYLTFDVISLDTGL